MNLPSAESLVKYKRGFDIKPKGINNFGTVVFTNGVADCFANQATCEAYGYHYDITREACMGFKPQDGQIINDDDTNVGNTKSGIRNIIEAGSFYNTISGVGNNTGENTSSNLITGRENEVKEGISSGLLSGDNGKLLRQGEVMAGGGSLPSNLANTLPAGYAQRSTLQLTGRTYDNSNIILLCNGKKDALITLRENTIIGYHVIFTSMNQIDGSYTHYEQKGVIKVKADKEAQICSAGLQAICGTVGVSWNNFTFLQTNTGGIFNDLQLRVQGQTGLQLLHHAVMHLQETHTNTNI